MNNKGQISVFLSLLMSGLSVLTLFSLGMVQGELARSRAEISVDGGMQHIFADYQGAMFRQYHLLFLDRTYGSESEAALEAKLETYLDYTLNPVDGNGRVQSFYEYQVASVVLTQWAGIMDGELEQFKTQMEAYVMEGAVYQEINETIEMITKEGGSRQQEAKNEMTTDIGNISLSGLLNGDNQTDFLSVLCPAGMAVSSQAVDLSGCPSNTRRDIQENAEEFDFNSITGVKEYLQTHPAATGPIASGLSEHIVGTAYGLSCFSNAVTKQEGGGQALAYEVEYIIGGHDNDKENLQETLMRIALIRLPFNYAYLMGDEGKKDAALVAAGIISVITGTELAIEAEQEIILAVWALAETIADVNCLLEGGAVPLLKDAGTWQTTLTQVGDFSVGLKAEETGLTYEAYLGILLATGGDWDLNYYRMLDLMELNIQHTYPEFEIENLIYAIEVDVEILWQEERFYFRKQYAY